MACVFISPPPLIGSLNILRNRKGKSEKLLWNALYQSSINSSRWMMSIRVCLLFAFISVVRKRKDFFFFLFKRESTGAARLFMNTEIYRPKAIMWGLVGYSNEMVKTSAGNTMKTWSRSSFQFTDLWKRSRKRGMKEKGFLFGCICFLFETENSRKVNQVF